MPGPEPQPHADASRVSTKSAIPRTPDQNLPIATLLESHGYKIGKTLGHGSYATVKHAYSDKYNCNVAVKIISKRQAPQDYLQKFLPREIDIIKTLKHRHLVCFLQCIESTTRVYMIMEIAEGGDLLEMIRAKGALAENVAGKWFRHLIDGMTYIHRRGVAHRDLKCENLLISKENELKITDFGFARSDMITTDGAVVFSDTYCGSYAYAAPEILKGTPYNPFLSDVWSIGVILYAMTFGRLPFDDTNHKKLLKQVQQPIEFTKKRIAPDDCKQLIKKILTSVDTRVYLGEILEDDWVKRTSNVAPQPGTEPKGTEECSPTQTDETSITGTDPSCEPGPSENDSGCKLSENNENETCQEEDGDTVVMESGSADGCKPTKNDDEYLENCDSGRSTLVSGRTTPDSDTTEV